ncbi:hypothetical protein ACN20G_27295 (plasmid) [Streptomyces sp. BI20]|uniref:hypothetical protein n=1 Tax=Streptomyces sp. BI20 TaxID=3403460 RepID=UPI003C78469D
MGSSATIAYERIAVDLLRGLRREGGAEDLPTPADVARRYRVSLATAQFVCRAARTRLRTGIAPTRRPRALAPDRPAPPRNAADLTPEAIARDLWERARSGGIAAALPTQDVLADSYGVPRAVIRAAVADLTRQGRAEFRGRAGTRLLLPEPEPEREPAAEDPVPVPVPEVGPGLSAVPRPARR